MTVVLHAKHEFQQRVLKQIYLEHLKFYPTKIDPRMTHHLLQFAIFNKTKVNLDIKRFSNQFTWLREVNCTTATRKSTFESVFPIIRSVDFFLVVKKKRKTNYGCKWVIATRILLVPFTEQSENKVSNTHM